MARWDLSEIIVYVSKFNSLGNRFFDEDSNYLTRISRILNIELYELDFSRNSIFILSEKLVEDYIYPIENRKIILENFRILETDLLKYLYNFEYKRTSNIFPKKGYLVKNNKFCPVYVNKNREVNIFLLKYIEYNFKSLEEIQFCHFPSSYGNSKETQKNYTSFLKDFDISVLNEYELIIV